MSDISPLLRKFLALTILIFVAYLIWTGVAQSVLKEFAAYEQHANRDREFLSRYMARASTKPALAAELERLSKLRTTSKGFLPTGNPALAAATLQDRLKRIVANSRSGLKSVQVLPTDADGDKRQIRVDVMINTEISRLKDILYQIETGAPYLFVDEINIRQGMGGPHSSIRQASRVDLPPIETPLQVRLRVSGFMREENS